MGCVPNIGLDGFVAALTCGAPQSCSPNSLVSEAASSTRPHPSIVDGADFSVLIAFLGRHFKQGSENG